MDAVLHGHLYVKSAIGVACWDILGQAVGLPVYKLLGGAAQDDVKLCRAISQEAPDAMARKIAGYRAEGYTKFQRKFGGNADDDSAWIRSCAGLMQPGDILVADANTGWTMHEATRIVQAVRDLDINVEQPCPI
mgnify:CR=1 FL=1